MTAEEWMLDYLLSELYGGSTYKNICGIHGKATYAFRQQSPLLHLTPERIRLICRCTAVLLNEAFNRERSLNWPIRA